MAEINHIMLYSSLFILGETYILWDFPIISCLRGKDNINTAYMYWLQFKLYNLIAFNIRSSFTMALEFDPDQPLFNHVYRASNLRNMFPRFHFTKFKKRCFALWLKLDPTVALQYDEGQEDSGRIWRSSIGWSFKSLASWTFKKMVIFHFLTRTRTKNLFDLEIWIRSNKLASCRQVTKL